MAHQHTATIRTDYHEDRGPTLWVRFGDGSCIGHDIHDDELETFIADLLMFFGVEVTFACSSSTNG